MEDKAPSHTTFRGSRWGDGFYGQRLKFWPFYNKRLTQNDTTRLVVQIFSFFIPFLFLGALLYRSGQLKSLGEEIT